MIMPRPSVMCKKCHETYPDECPCKCHERDLVNGDHESIYFIGAPVEVENITSFDDDGVIKNYST